MRCASELWGHPIGALLFAASAQSFTDSPQLALMQQCADPHSIGTDSVQDFKWFRLWYICRFAMIPCGVTFPVWVGREKRFL